MSLCGGTGEPDPRLAQAQAALLSPGVIHVAEDAPVYLGLY